jgi:aryl-alcohol dehydrogenase-like predicted oxidoreductase
MEKRQLGKSGPSASLRTGLEVSVLGLGCMRMSAN